MKVTFPHSSFFPHFCLNIVWLVSKLCHYFNPSKHQCKFFLNFFSQCFKGFQRIFVI